MSYQQLQEDQDTVRALDESIAAFKASLGSDDGDDVFRARTKVYEALLACVFRAASLRGKRKRGELEHKEPEPEEACEWCGRKYPKSEMNSIAWGGDETRIKRICDRCCDEGN